jgi:ribosomal protein S18 acetylase RimI-like enzyme
MNVEIIKADYLNPAHGRAIGHLLNAYASDLMGGGKFLDPKLLEKLPTELSKLPHAFSLIAYFGADPVGLVNCFEGFSTFKCKPLINIHDMVVLKAFRGQGIAQKLLKATEAIAIEHGCCKLTLEVLSNNQIAQGVYRKFGFSDYALDPSAGTALFWEKFLG